MATVHKKTTTVSFKPGGLIGTAIMNLFTQTYTPPPVVITQPQTVAEVTMPTENTLVRIPTYTPPTRAYLMKQYPLIPVRPVFSSWPFDNFQTRMQKFQTYLQDNLPKSEAYIIVSKESVMTKVLQYVIRSIKPTARIEVLTHYNLVKRDNPRAVVLNNYPIKYSTEEQKVIDSNFKEVDGTFDEYIRENHQGEIEIQRLIYANKKKRFTETKVVKQLSRNPVYKETWLDDIQVHARLKRKVEWETSGAWLVPTVNKKAIWGRLDDEGFALTRMR